MRLHPLGILLVLCLWRPTLAGELKEWHDPAGKVIAKAEMVGIDRTGQLQLKKDDGRVVALAMTRLSADDQVASLPDILREVDRQSDAARKSVDEVIQTAKTRQARDAKLQPDKIAIARAARDLAQQAGQICRTHSQGLMHGALRQQNQTFAFRGATASIQFEYKTVQKTTKNNDPPLWIVDRATVTCDQVLQFSDGFAELAKQRNSTSFPIAAGASFNVNNPGIANIELSVDANYQQLISKIDAALQAVSADLKTENKAELQEYEKVRGRIDEVDAQLKRDADKIQQSTDEVVKKAVRVRDLSSSGSRSLTQIAAQLDKVQKKNSE